MLFLKLLAAYLPIEVFVLKWLPVSEPIYSILRQIPDLLVFLMSGILLFLRILSRKPIPIIGGKVDVFLCLFIFWAFTTIILNPMADGFIGLANIKALLRYVLLIYIVLLLNPTPKQIRSLIRWVFIAIVLQIFIALIQFVGGSSIRNVLVARHISDGIGGIVKVFTGAKFEDSNDLIGTMGDTISFAYFMLIGMILWLFSHKSSFLKLSCGILIFLALIYLSGSRSVVLASIMFIIGYNVWKHGWNKSAIFLIILLPIFSIVGLIAVNSGLLEANGDNRSFWFIFNSDYIQMALNQRLGIIVYIVPRVLFSAQNIIGFSPDKYYFTEFVGTNLPLVPDILRAVLPNVLEDVYWVAMYIYYGLIGFSLWIGLLSSLYRRLNEMKSDLISSRYNIILLAKAILLISIPLNFLNQAFEARTFSFYLWLFCALALVQRRNAIRMEYLLK